MFSPANSACIIILKAARCVVLGRFGYSSMPLVDDCLTTSVRYGCRKTQQRGNLHDVVIAERASSNKQTVDDCTDIAQLFANRPCSPCN